jgi:hypothetical protein
VKQCKACPWKVTTQPEEDIPGDYCEKRHEALKATIANPGELPFKDRLLVMACHESQPGSERHCVGWVAHQLGPGNNVTLRLSAMDGRFKNFQTIGPQHERFEDTLPS